MASQIQSQVSQWWIFAVFLCLAVAAIIAAVILLRNPGEEINSFHACKNAGGAILESYPERCIIDGRSFTNEEQLVDGDVSGYVGLEEQTALDKAAAENKPARVVERDGESLPVTMDLVPGRLNFSVKDGRVSGVEVESDGGEY